MNRKRNRLFSSASISATILSLCIALFSYKFSKWWHYLIAIAVTATFYIIFFFISVSINYFYIRKIKLPTIINDEKREINILREYSAKLHIKIEEYKKTDDSNEYKPVLQIEIFSLQEKLYQHIQLVKTNINSPEIRDEVRFKISKDELQKYENFYDKVKLTNE